jgi:hypothetical protein
MKKAFKFFSNVFSKVFFRLMEFFLQCKIICWHICTVCLNIAYLLEISIDRGLDVCLNIKTYINRVHFFLKIKSNNT